MASLNVILGASANVTFSAIGRHVFFNNTVDFDRGDLFVHETRRQASDENGPVFRYVHSSLPRLEISEK